MAELNTYGDLKKVIKLITLKQKGEKIGNVALDTVIGLIPGADIAKTTFDFIRAAISKPDAKKTNTWLDKLDVDDKMSAIVDDTVENGFMQAMAAAIEQEPDNKPLEPDFNMNAKMVNYLKQQYGGRHITGIQENMNLKEKLKQLIRKELEEMSATSGGEAYSTPRAFTPKGQKKNTATKYAEKEGWKIAKKPTTSKVVDYKKIFEMEKNNEAIDNIKKSRRFIPREFEFPSFLLEPITINDTSKVYFKVATNDKGESILMIDPLIKAMLDNIERGRTSFSKEQRLPVLARYIKEKVPSSIRGLIKKAADGAKIVGNNFIPLNLILTKNPEISTAISNKLIKINPEGIQLLKSVKADPNVGAGLEDEILLLVWLYKNQTVETTPADYAAANNISNQLAARISNKTISKNYVDVKDIPSDKEGDTWYIKNPYMSGEYEDINVKMYEGLLKELANASVPVSEIQKILDSFATNEMTGAQLFNALKDLLSKYKSMKENKTNLNSIIKQELLNEVTYSKFKNEVKFRTKSEQLHKAIREVKRKLQEIDRIVEYTSRMKQELSEDGGINYWKATQKNIGTISEMVNQLNNKIKNLHQ